MFGDIESRTSSIQKATDMGQRPQTGLGYHCKRQYALAMAVDHAKYVRPRTVNFAVNEPLEEQCRIVGADAVAIEVVLHDIFRRHQSRGLAYGHQEAVGTTGMAGADMAEGVQDPHFVKDPTPMGDVETNFFRDQQSVLSGARNRGFVPRPANPCQNGLSGDDMDGFLLGVGQHFLDAFFPPDA